MSVRASVVIPVFNPGHYLDACIESLRRQTLPESAWEAVFVDDGSTDGSGPRLDRLAEELPNVRVTHIFNSGWPGRPRNVGLDMAAGEFVLFCDHDDWLGEEALERMVATADRNGSDVVVAREVGHGRGVPLELFRRNLDDARLGKDPLLRLMTPHKLFRRSMLDEHAIRFPEGRRRFEDHVFVLRAYFAARRISVLADYPCYHWMTRTDRANASDEYADPRAYYRDLRDVFDIVDANTAPGQVRDQFTSHWYRRRCLDRLRGERWADGPGGHELEVFEAVRGLAQERIGPGVVACLPLSHRLRSRAVMAGRTDIVSALARMELRMGARMRVHRLVREGRSLRLDLSADVLDSARNPMRFNVADDGRIRWSPPDPALSDLHPPDALDATDDLEGSVVSVVLRRPDRTLQYDWPATIERVLRTTPAGPVLSIAARAEIDLGRVAAGRELDGGAWDLWATVESCGWHVVHRLPPVRTPGSSVPVHVAIGSGGGIGLVIGQPPASTASRGPVRRPTRRHPIERIIPHVVVRHLPPRVRAFGKRLLLRLDRS